jgi:beta-1,4-mannosyl-glycoprotein beta-1,4-N-acetylglucosaminyltransferase
MKKLYLFIVLTISFYCFDVFSMHYRPKIYDCFMFYNEFEVLEIKLNELYDHVDCFVIVESTESFRGNPKPLYFYENRERYSKFLDKIIHVVADRIEAYSPWVRESYQRNQIRKGLLNLNNWDVVIIEDLDEIVRPSKLREILSLLFDHQVKCVCCRLNRYDYYLNRWGRINGNGPYELGSAVMKYADLKKISPQKLRERRIFGHILNDAGWHFSYMGGVSKVIEKLENFSHSELDTEAFKNAERIRKNIASMQLAEIDETYPKFVQENVDYFKELGLIDTL